MPPFSFWTQWGAFHRKSPVPPRTPMGPQNAHGVKRAEEHPRICQTTSGSKLWTVSERHERLVIQQQGVMEPDGREVAPVRRHIHQSECCSTGKSKLAGHARHIANTPGLAPRLPVVTRAHLSAFQFSRGRKDRLIRRPCCTSRAGRCVRTTALLNVIRAARSTPKRARYRAVKSASFSGFHSSAPAFQLAFETLQPVSAVPCSRTTGWPHS